MHLLLSLMLAAGALWAQPGTMSINQDVGGTYANSATTLKGGVFQARFQENASGTASGTRNWQFNADGYFNTWGVLSTNGASSVTLAAYNTGIQPNAATASANFQGGPGYNSKGRLPATTANFYYTYNIIKGSSYASQLMSVLETSFDPVAVSAVTQAAGTFGSRAIGITTGATPDAGENIFVRYSTDGYVTSTIVQATGSGTAWSATIPWQSSAVSFYVYTSNKTLAAINADVTTNGQAAHDLAMLNLNNNAGANYSWTPVTGNIIVTSTGGTGAAGVGYSTFTVAGGVFAALNAGTAHTGTVTALITANVTTETGATVLSNSAVWTSLGVQPSGARTVSGSVAAPMIDLSGADNVTIDGLNTGGNSLTISNTNSGTTSTTSTFRFIGDATNNTITNCTVLGSFSGGVTTNGGTLFFSTSTTNGNDNNTISYCNIGPAGTNLPTKAIYGNGSTTSTTRANSGIIIDNCNIYDFFLASGANAGIYANDGNTDWTITNNKLYQTATRTFTTGATHSGIFINGSTTANNNNSITGNTVGYSSAAGTGTYTIAGNVTWLFVPINISTAGTTTATVIQNNTIAGIAMSGSSSGTSSSAPFRGIYIGAGLTTVSGNTIGSLSATGSITYTSSSTSASDVIGMFNFGSSNWISNNNNIGGITAGNSSTGAANIYALRCNTSSSATWTCTGNTIGGTVSNSIQSTSTATGTIVNGILNSNPIGTFTGNTVRNMSVAGGTGTGSTSAMVGIAIAASSANHTVGSNTIFNLSSSLAGAAVVSGINFNSSNGTNLIEKNLIYNLDANSATASINGINIIGGTTTYRNNMISLGNTGNSATVGMAINGINETTAGTDNLYFNSIYIGGAPTTGASNSFAFQSSITTNTRAYQNNVFFNARSNNGSTGKHYAIRVGGTAANPSGLTSNYNVLFSNGTGGFTGLFNSIDRASITDWRTATGQDAISFSSDPQFLSPSAATPDLHINPAATTVIEGNGLAIGTVTDDYDGQTRATFTPTDIGADAGNFMGLDLTSPAITYTPLANTCTAGATTLTATITDASGVPTAGAGLPVLYWKINAGAYTAATGTFVSGSDYSFTFGAGSVAGDVISYYIVAQDNAATPNVAVSPAAGAAGLTANPPAATTPPTTPSSFSILNALSGTYTVGSGGAYATLTAAVAAYNNSCLTGPVVFSLTDATYTTPAETFPISINSNTFASAVNTLTIKPATGISPTITGSNINALLKLNGADYVVIDGSNSNTANTLCPSVLATRDLTITNTNSAAAAIVWMGSTSAANGATNNTIKNTNFAGATGSFVTFGIFSGSASASSPGTIAAAPNSNNTIENCSIKLVINALFLQGVSNIASLDQNWVIRSNAIGSATLADKVTGVGMLVQNAQNFSIDNNNIAGVASSTGSTSLVSGIQLTGLLNGGNVYQNKISDIKQRNTGGYGANGIYLNATSTAANVNVYNNFIWDVAGVGFSTAGANDNGYGIMVNAGGGYNIDFNTVVMNANQTSTVGLPAAINISSLIVTAGSLKIRNNIFVNAQTAGNTQRYAIYCSAANTVFSEINYNNYYSTTGPNLGFIGSARATLANIQAGFGGNLNSVSINPVFTSATDLHLVPASNQMLDALGTPIAGITTDIDCDTRDAVTPDMGADEFTPPPCTGAVGGTAAGSTAFCVSGTPTITATGYSTGIGSGYQWISSTNAGDYPAAGTPVAGQINPAALATGVVSTTTYYWLRVTCPSGTATDNSTLVTVTINPSAAVITGPATKCTADPAIALTESGGTGTSWTWAPGGATTQSINVSPVATTTYTVTVTSPGACVKTATYVVTVATSPTVTATASPNPLCINTQLNLSSSATFAANAYALSSITYGPTTDPGGASVITGDDAVSASQTLPFTFNFFGTNYTTVFIYTNGFIQLGTSSGSISTYALLMPSNVTPNTIIGGVWSDLNATGAAAIRAYTTGSVGSRIYTVHFSNVPFYTTAGGNVTGNTDFYIQLHETSNIVEVHVGEVTSGTFTNNRTLGIENSGGTAALTPAGRNAALWTVSTAAKEAYRFIPNAIVSYAWTGPDAYTANTQNPSIPSVTANNAGTYTVQVTDVFGCSATSTTAAVVVTPNVSAGTVSGTTPLCIGAMATYSSDGTAGGTWSSTNTSVATVVPGTGVVTAMGAGTTDIVYTVGTGCGSPVSAMQTLTVDPNANAGTVSGTTPLCIGAMATYSSNGDAGGTWSSTNTGVATVDPGTGLVTAVGAGTTDIVYTVSTGCNNPVSAMQSLTVDPTVTAGTVSGTSPLCIGSTTTYSSNGTAGGTWSSTNTSAATVHPSTGLVTAVGAGMTDIIYTVNTGCGSPVSAMQTLTVDPTVTAGTVSGTTPLCVGLEATYSSTGTAGGTWSSTNTSVATVHASTGFVTAMGGGSTDITYTVNTGCGSPTSAFQSLTVNPLPNAGTIGGTLSVCVGQSTSLNSNGDSGGEWSSSNPNNAAVDNAGLVSGLVSGTVTITYAVTDNNGCFSSTTVVVTVNANPGVFMVTGGGVYCMGGAGLSVGLSGSETGVNYQLKKDNVNQGSPVVGTGAALAFPVQTASGTYTVEATGTAPVCTIPMTGSVTISAVSCDCYPSIVSASPATYDDGWQTGDNDNPSGFGTWTLSTTNPSASFNGHFIGNSTGNNACGGPSGDSNADGDINGSGDAWGMYANGGGQANAVRPFLSNMVIGGSFKIRMDNGCVDAGQAVGFGIQNASGNNLSEFYFQGGGTDYVLNDGSGVSNTGIGFSDEGVEVVYTRTGASTYTVKITRLVDGATVTLARSFNNPAGGQLPKQVRLFNGNAGSGSNADVFFNNMEICIPCTPISATLSGVATICAGNSANISATITGGVGPYTLVLFDGANNSTVTEYASGTNIPVSPASTSTYTIVSITDALGCGASATLSGSAVITVTQLPNPGSISGTLTVCTGLMTTLTSNGLGGGTWSSSNTEIATVGSGTGVVTGVTTGVVTITYTVTASSCPNSTSIQVTVTQTPNAGTIGGTATVCTGLTTNLTSNGLAGGTWSSDNTPVATVHPTTGVVTGVTSGTATITYMVSASGCNSSTTRLVTVNQTPNAGTISGTTTVCSGLTTPLSSNGLGGGTWSSNNLPVATVNPSNGIVTGVAGGTATITYTVTANGCTSSTNTLVTVNQTPSAGVISGTTTVCTGLTTALSSNGAAGGTWSSNNPTSASVNPGTGLVSGVASGSATITYTVTASGCTSSTNVLVAVNQTPNAGTISGTTTVCSGLMTTLGSNGLGGGTWSSSNGSVATVNPINGVVTGLVGGSATITYTVTANGCTSSSNTLVTVNQTPNAGVIGGTTTVCAGQTTQLNSNGLSGGTWMSSNMGVATIDGNGLVSGLNIVGGTTITYTVTSGGCTSSTTATVTVISSPNPGTIVGSTGCIGTTTNFTSTGQTGGAWSSSNMAVATINPSSGVLTGVSGGTTTVTYTLTFGSCTASTSTLVTVSACNAIFGGRIIWSRDGITGVKDATVTVSGSASGSVVTPASGLYSITVSPGSSFTITPTKTLNKLNGVNAQDVFRINQHATLNPLLISNPYELVAADVNGNNVITPLDANIIQLSLLGNTQALAQWISSWRFVPTSHTMTNPPWGFPEKVTLTGSAVNVDFYGIKVGDVAAIYANPANGGTGAPFVLRTPDQVLEAGRTIEADFAADALSDIAALQFALRFDPEQLQLANIMALNGLPLSGDNFGTYEADAGSVRMVWAGLSPVALKQTAPVFRLTFKVLESGSRLSEVLGLDDETLPGHVYNSRSAESGVSLRFDASTAVGNLLGNGQVQLLQNRPNPFVHDTRIGFILPEACEAQLRIFDAAGRLVTERTQQYPAGRHDESFDLSGVSGLLYYELTTPFGVLAKKMTKVE